MTTPLSRMPKPGASQYAGRRKLFLVPSFMAGPDAPEELQRLLDSYWSEVRDHVANLERSLGTVAHAYHEMVSAGGDEGIAMLQMLNPKVGGFIQALCISGAGFEAAEDRALVEENVDWQRCISIGLASEKVLQTALDGYQESTRLRWEHVAARIDETLEQSEAGILFIREDHRVQFPSDVQVFYVAPPSLDSIKRWLDNRLIPSAPSGEEVAEEEASRGSAVDEAGAGESAPPDEKA